MKLYEVMRNSTIKVIDPVSVPPDAPDVKCGEVLKFHHIDGMYSYCHNEKGEVVHIPAWAEVEYV